MRISDLSSDCALPICPVPATIEIGGITLAFDDPRVPEATRAALTKGRYEFKERELARRVLRRGDRVIELGSGMGVVSLIMARLIGAEAVMTFEANPGIVELTRANRSEEHTSELQSLMRISYAVFCLKKKKHKQ